MVITVTGDPNAVLPYRPLWAGISVISTAVGSRGTIGCFARDSADEAWLITARHVFSSTPAVADSSVRVFQPDNFVDATPINVPGMWRLDASKEVIAAKLVPTVRIVPAWPTFGPCTGIAMPTHGMVVTKAGIATAVTQGVIKDIDAQGFSVERVADLPGGYRLSDGGDSGAAWIQPASRAIVGIHIGLRPDGSASVKRIDAVLESMGHLKLFV